MRERMIICSFQGGRKSQDDRSAYVALFITEPEDYVINRVVLPSTANRMRTAEQSKLISEHILGGTTTLL
jgi:hypothetical protein